MGGVSKVAMAMVAVVAVERAAGGWSRGVIGR